MEVSIISRISTPESVAVVILTIYNVHCGISIKLLRLVIEEGVVNSLFAIFFFCSIIGNIFVRSFTCIMRLDNNMVCCLVVVDAADFQTSISNNFCPGYRYFHHRLHGDHYHHYFYVVVNQHAY